MPQVVSDQSENKAVLDIDHKSEISRPTSVCKILKLLR